jgi:hypothetical protein
MRQDQVLELAVARDVDHGDRRASVLGDDRRLPGPFDLLHHLTGLPGEIAHGDHTHVWPPPAVVRQLSDKGVAASTRAPRSYKMRLILYESNRRPGHRQKLADQVRSGDTSRCSSEYHRSRGAA